MSFTVTARHLGAAVVVVFVVAFVFIFGMLGMIVFGAWRWVTAIRLAPHEDDVEYEPSSRARPNRFDISTTAYESRAPGYVALALVVALTVICLPLARFWG